MAAMGGSVVSQVGELPGRLGAEYDVERVLSQGPRGTAIVARSVESGRAVVVKLFAGCLADDEVGRARFLRAAELAMRLSHPNVVRVFEAGIDPQPYLVTEHVAGEALAERLARRRLSATETMTLATHLAAGLAHAHVNGVVHGALDRDTVLLGDDGVARIADFGLGRLLDGAPPATDPRHCGPAADVSGLARVLRTAAGEPLDPALTALLDAALAHPSVRPTAFDVFHRMLTMTSPPGVWLPSALASGAAPLYG